MQCVKQCLVHFKDLILLLLNSVSHSCTSSQLLLVAIMDKMQTFWLTLFLMTTTALIIALII